MGEPSEMSASSQVINELDASGLASLKQLAFWSGLHENTVRDYRDGRIKHFGSEMRFWSGVLQGLMQQYHPAIPQIAFRICGMLLKGTTLTISAIKQPELRNTLDLATAINQFLKVNESVTAAMQSVVEILRDGRVDAGDDANIIELETMADVAITNLWQVKHCINMERRKAGAR